MEMQNLGNIPVPQNPVKVLSKFDLKKMWPYIAGAFLVVVAGVGTAWLLSGKVLGGGGSKAVAPGATKTVNEAGILDPNADYTNAVGTLVEEGIGDEGTHHLEREGGSSKNVYLTSSVIDLQSFVGKKVEVWGETLASKKAGWLMDIVKIKVTE